MIGHLKAVEPEKVVTYLYLSPKVSEPGIMPMV
jgi:hypothetical protein